MPVEQGPFEQIVNVQWDEGLAVIFGPEDIDAPIQEPEESTRA